jgi:hypothetical protein
MLAARASTAVSAGGRIGNSPNGCTLQYVSPTYAALTVTAVVCARVLDSNGGSDSAIAWQAQRRHCDTLEQSLTHTCCQLLPGAAG